MVAPAARTITIQTSGSAGISTFQKTVAEVLDFTLNWATWLGSDTISTSTWTVDAGITAASSSNNTTTATIFLSGGGSPGATYLITDTIVTAAGRTATRSFYVTTVTTEFA